MKRILYSLYLVLISSLCLYAQKEKAVTDCPTVDRSLIRYKWLGTVSYDFTDMGVIYKKPSDFKEIGDAECFKENPHLNRTFTCLFPKLVSSDGQFIAFGPIVQRAMAKDPTKPLNTIGLPMRNDSHLWQMRGYLRAYFGNDVDWQQMLQYYSEDVAKRQFNADTAIRTSFDLRLDDFYKNEFKYVDILIIHKKDRGYVHFNCFYTDKAKKKLSKYWAKIEGVLSYEANFEINHESSNTESSIVKFRSTPIEGLMLD